MSSDARHALARGVRPHGRGRSRGGRGQRRSAPRRRRPSLGASKEVRWEDPAGDEEVGNDELDEACHRLEHGFGQLSSQIQEMLGCQKDVIVLFKGLVVSSNAKPPPQTA